MALLVTGIITFSFLTLDETLNYDDSFTRLQTFIGAITCTIASYFIYSQYSFEKAKLFSKVERKSEYPRVEEVKITQRVKNIFKCPNCASENTLHDDNYIYCLDCGGVSRLEKAITTS